MKLLNDDLSRKRQTRICLLAAFGFRRYIESKIGGMTGDTLGAGSEVIEILFYSLCVAATTLNIIK